LNVKKHKIDTAGLQSFANAGGITHLGDMSEEEDDKDSLIEFEPHE
jgi:hypothetical protein